MRRRKFLSVTPSVLGLKPIADICDPDEFKQFGAVDYGEVPPGVEWVVTKMDVQRPNDLFSKDEYDDAALSNTTLDSKESSPPLPDDLPEDKKQPTVLDVSTDLLGYDPKYLDDGYVYDFTVKVGVPLVQVLRGVDFSFGSASSFAWKMLFDIEYTVDDWRTLSHEMPLEQLVPKNECVEFTITFRFEFEWKLRRYLVVLTDADEKTDEWPPEIDDSEDSDVVIGKAENSTESTEKDPVPEETKSKFK